MHTYIQLLLKKRDTLLRKKFGHTKGNIYDSYLVGVYYNILLSINYVMR